MNPYAPVTDHIGGVSIAVAVLASLFAGLAPFVGAKGYFKNFVTITCGFIALIWMAMSIGLVWGDFLRNAR